jgi:hypothetical protein
VAPDGRSFVSERFNQKTRHMTILITDARGTRPLLDSSMPDLIAPWAYTASGNILVDDYSRPAGSRPGPLPYWNLKLLDPNTGVLEELPFRVPQLPMSPNSEAGYNRYSNAIWYSVANASGGTTISRFDLANGTMTEWINSTDFKGTANLAAVDLHGSPIIQVAASDVWHTDPAKRGGIEIKTLLVSSPHTATLLNSGRIGQAGVAGAFSPLSATSAAGVWLASDDGAIWLYTSDRALQRVAKVTTSSRGAPGVAISGPCG